MSAETLRKMNRALYAASFHLLEASKHLSNVEAFRPAGFELAEKALFLNSIIQTDTFDKMTESQVNSVLDEIFSLPMEETK
jgi:hypothetical protein